MRRPRVEILYFASCPNHEPTRELVEQVAEELRIGPEIRFLEVTDSDAAVELRFLGSPTVRVDGVDVEPGAEARRDFALACRIYRSHRGVGGQLQEAWLRKALTEATK